MKTHYDTPAKIFHWLMAALILFQVPLAFVMVATPPSPDKLAQYALHKSLGITLFALVALRLAWRLVSPPPPFPETMPGWQRMSAHAIHWALYVLLFAQPVIGWLHSSAANFPVSYFGLFTLPNLIAPDRMLTATLVSLHHFLGDVLIGVFLLHLAAALYHHFVRRDAVLLRMIPFASSTEGGDK